MQGSMGKALESVTGRERLAAIDMGHGFGIPLPQAVAGSTTKCCASGTCDYQPFKGMPLNDPGEDPLPLTIAMGALG
jgi:hypothetical protein